MSSVTGHNISLLKEAIGEKLFELLQSFKENESLRKHHENDITSAV